MPIFKFSRILLLFYDHCIPRLIGYQNIAFIGVERHQLGNGRLVYGYLFVHAELSMPAT